MRLLALGLFVIVLTLTTPVFAQTEVGTTPTTSVATPTPSRKPVPTKKTDINAGRKEAIDAKKEAVSKTRDTMKESTEASRGVAKEAAMQKQESFQTIRYEWVIKRMEAGWNRLNNILERIESRIEKVGKTQSVTEAMAHVDVAHEHLLVAQAALEELKAELEAIMAAETNQEVQSAFNTKAKEVKTALIDAHKEIRLAVSALMKARAAGRPAGVVTPATSASTTVTPTLTTTPEGVTE